MDIRYPIHIFALLSLSQASSAQKKPAMDQKKPNVLFVMSDQHRRQALGFMKEDPVITPNLDKFAKEAVLLGPILHIRYQDLTGPACFQVNILKIIKYSGTIVVWRMMEMVWEHFSKRVAIVLDI